MRLLLRQDLVLKKGDSFDFSPVAEKLSALGSTLAVDITISGHQLDVSGRANDLMAFGRLIQSSNFADMMIQDIHIEAQLASLYHEFITGKKNGKLNKIIKSCSVQLDLVEPSPFALLLQVRSPSLNNAMEAYQQLIVSFWRRGNRISSDCHTFVDITPPYTGRTSS